ncbi:hypothetical protein UFOVP459_55 [uncultured Caudovirales phage]|uniref:Uncharacterized protein n=1 Tax=uncultured Caudovirales phage TaxID=2100421 RepID=A0A6J5QN48_9CAUD|nr:hypothetical protein UFOVP459_55 [uncultured Caudovirales phage]CAB4182951.1 hypothetical protein UFOVP1089_30 [uncultured Caudovirales phage]CAB4212939.1 hypothetical protein UFOVP1443_49 [uncultured Caudovirales phage]
MGKYIFIDEDGTPWVSDEITENMKVNSALGRGKIIRVSDQRLFSEIVHLPNWEKLNAWEE